MVFITDDGEADLHTWTLTQQPGQTYGPQPPPDYQPPTYGPQPPADYQPPSQPFWNEATQRTEDPGHPGRYWSSDLQQWVGGDLGPEPTYGPQPPAGFVPPPNYDLGFNSSALAPQPYGPQEPAYGPQQPVTPNYGPVQWNQPQPLDPGLQNAMLGEKVGTTTPIPDMYNWNAEPRFGESLPQGGGGLLGSITSFPGNVAHQTWSGIDTALSATPGYKIAQQNPDRPLWQNILQGEMTSLLPKAATENLPNPWYFPARDVAEGATSPLGIAFMGAGGGESALGTVGRNLVSLAGGLVAQRGTERYGETNLPGADIAANPWVQNAAGLVGGVTAYKAPEIAGAIGNRLSKAVLPESALTGLGKPAFGNKLGEIPTIAGAADTSPEDIARVAAKERANLVALNKKGIYEMPGWTPPADDRAVLQRAADWLQGRKDAPVGLSPSEQARLDVLRSLADKPPAAAVAEGEANNARRALLDAVQQEAKIRRAGTAAGEIAAGRATQSAGIGSAADQAVAGGANIGEARAAMGAGAKTGPLRKTFAAPLALDDVQQNQLLREILDYTGNKRFDALRATSALDKLIKGEGLQPGEIKQLRTIFGDEVASAIEQANKGRIVTTAGFSEADLAEIERRAVVDGKQVAKMEVQARNQHALADDLMRESYMNPTDPRYVTAAKEARARAVRLENDADAKVIELTQRAQADTAAKNARLEQQATVKANREASRFQEAKDLADARAEQKALMDDLMQQHRDMSEGVLAENKDLQRAIRKVNERETAYQRYLDRADASERAASQRYLDEQAAKAARGEQRTVAKANAAEVKAQLRADKLNPNDQMILDKAEAILGKLRPGEQGPLKSADQLESVRLWLKGNRAILDGMGSDAPNVADKIGSMLTGDVADSYMAALLHRKAYIQSALEQQGLDEGIARKVTKLLTEREVKLKFGANAPGYVAEMLDEAKSLPYGSKGAIGGLASVSQELKNTQFGIGDFAVLGQQGLKAGTTGWVNITAGVVNKLLSALHLPSVDTELETTLAKKLQYQLDGVAQGAHTGITDLSKEGTLVRHLGTPGRLLDEKAIVPATSWLTDLQFGKVLGSVRNINHEGNLVLAKLAGADISNPAVRARAAAFANANTSAAAMAQRSGRAAAEKAFLLSPSMRRAQASQIVQVGKGLIAGSRTDRVLAAATIASFAGSVLAAQKLLHDYVGVGPDFEWNPAKKGFGNVTLPGGTVINPFPQEQVLKAIAQSYRLLDGTDQAELTDVAKRWGELLVSSASPAVRPFLASVGVGYDPGRGYRWGDLGSGKGIGERALDAAPIPPIVTQVARDAGDGLSSVARGVGNVAGLNVYPESGYSVRNRDLMNNPAFDQYKIDGSKPASWDNLNALGQAKWNAENGKLPSNNPEVIANREVSATLRTADAKAQAESDQKYARPGTTIPIDAAAGSNWRDDYHTLQYGVQKEYKALNLANPYTGPASKDPMRLALDEWSATIDASTVGVKPDWEKVDAWRAANPDKANLVDQYISGKPNTDLTPMVTAYKQASGEVGDAGFFDIKDSVWKQMGEQNPALQQFKDYYAWADAQVQRLVDANTKLGISPEKARTDAQSEIGKASVSKNFDDLVAGMKEQWVLQHPQAAFDAWRWGYFGENGPKKEIKQYLDRLVQAGTIH